MKCPICGKAELVRTSREEFYSYRRHCLAIRSVKEDHCAACNAWITDREETERVMKLKLMFNGLVDALIGARRNDSGVPTFHDGLEREPVSNAVTHDDLRTGADACGGLRHEKRHVGAARRDKPRFTMAELLAASSYDDVQSGDERAWLDVPPVGREL